MRSFIFPIINSHHDQYRRQLKYVADNPRRLLLKRLHPELFFRKWEIILGDLSLTASGNIFLLHSPSLINVRFSRRYTPQQWHELKEQYLAVIYNRGTLISPFIHPEEKAIRDEAISQGANIIRICDTASPTVLPQVSNSTSPAPHASS